MSHNYVLVETKDFLDAMVVELSKETIIGFDLECENNLHHYGVYITIMQISTKERNYVVDVQKISDISPLLTILEDNTICKIFHDVSFDFRVLKDQFNCKVKGVFDSQLAAAFIGEKNLGLGALLEKYYGVKKQRKFQMADWTKRPLTDEMLSYAIKDSCYLIQLKELLEKKLIELDRLQWVHEEFIHLESLDWNLPFQSFDQFPRFVHYTDSERGAIKALYELRDVLAQKVNRPVHFIMSNKKMAECINSPPSIDEWKSMKGVHPIVKNKAKVCFETMKKGFDNPIAVKKHIPKKASMTLKSAAEKLLDKRNSISKKLSLEGHYILSKEQLKQFVFEDDSTALRSWQKELLEI